MRLVNFLILLLSPGFAYADPVFTPIALILGVSATTVAIAVQVAFALGSAIYGSAQQRKAKKKARDEYNASLTDRTATVVSAESPYRYVYGIAKVGSSIVAMFTSGEKDQFKHLVCVHAAHECTNFLEIYVAGKALGPLDSAGWVTSGDFFGGTTESVVTDTTASLVQLPKNATGILVFRRIQSTDTGDGASGAPTTDEQMLYSFNPINGQLSFSNDGRRVTITYQYFKGDPKVRVSKHLGTPNDGVDLGLHNDTNGAWKATDVLRGFTYTVITLNLSQPEFQGGPPTVEALLQGKKLYDVRDGVTRWSNNPALVVYDYLVGEVCNIDPADLPLADFITAANVCEENVGGGALRYTFMGAVTADQAPAPVLEKMAQAMAGGIVSTTWSIWAGKYVAPVLALQQSDIVGSFALTPGASDSDKFNGVKGQYLSVENSYVATDFIPYQNPTYLAADGEERWTNIDFPFTDEVWRAHTLSRIFTEDARNGYTIKATFSLKAWAVKPGQRVTMTSALFGWNAKVFRVTDKSYSPTSMVELTLKEDDPSIWDLADAVEVDVTPNSDLPNPFVVAPLAYLNPPESGANILLMQSDGSILSRMLVTWPATNQVGTSIVIEWQVAGGDGWQQMMVSGDQTQAYLAPLEDGLIYIVRAKVVKPSINAESDWRYISHQVIGKSEPPSDVPWLALEGNTITWGTVADIDVAGYLLRYHYGNNRSWGDANRLHAGVVTQSPFTPDSVPQGPITLMVKAIDMSGNESGVAATIQTRLGDVLVANIVEARDWQALGFPGTITGGTVVGGILKANGTSSFYGQDKADFFKPGDSLGFYTDLFSHMVYETPIFTPTQAAVGSNMTFALDISSGGVLIEYRVSGGDAMFSTVGTDPFYKDGSLPFYGQPDVYQPWPGQIAAKNLQYQFRITTYQSAIQGVINVCNVVIDVPDKETNVNNFAVASGGTRLPLAVPFTVVENIQLTLLYDGGTAVGVQIVDKDAVQGPLIRCINGSGGIVAGRVNATIQGY
jgi:hypothetical protein